MKYMVCYFISHCMGKNIVIAVLVLALLAEGALVLRYRGEFHTARAQAAKLVSMPPAGPNAKGAGRPILLTKGMNLKSTPLFKYAFQIAPGDLSTEAKHAVTGWNITAQNQSNGSTVVTLIPKDSDDTAQQYTIKPGQTLYFIEQTPTDDKADQDKDLNYRDDYGLVTDSQGNIQ